MGGADEDVLMPEGDGDGDASVDGRAQCWALATHMERTWGYYNLPGIYWVL